MSGLSEMEASVAEYQAQLDMITTALASDQNNSDLLTLKAELTTLLKLTKDSLLEMKKAELLAQVEELGGTGENDQVMV